MSKKIKLDSIIESVEIQTDEHRVYLNVATYEIVYALEDFDEPVSWRKDLISYEEIEYDDDYLRIPTLYDFHEHQVMVEFSKTTSPEIQEHLLNALYKKGAFRNFRNLTDRFFLTDKWYAFKEEKLKEFVIEWCEENNINYEL